MRLAGANKGVEQPVPNLIREKLTIDEVSPKKTGQAEKQEPSVKSYRAERKENVLWTFLANEPAGVGQYGVKNNSSDTINYRDNLFIFCKAGVIQMAKPAPFFSGNFIQA